MNTNVRDTSRETYDELKRHNKLTPMQYVIFNAVYRHGDLTRSELSDITGLPINTVCGRANELLKKGVLVDEITRKCRSTGRNVHTLTLNQNQVIIP